MRVLLVALAIAGCSKKAADNGPPCPVVVDHMVVVIKEGIKGHESVNLGDRQQMITQCENRKMSAAERRCMATAKDLAQLASCRPAKSPPPGPPPNTPPPPPSPPAAAAPPPSAPTPTAPAPTGEPAQPAGSAG